MIDWLEIRQLAIAEHIELEFGRAFTAVTGETGSGKSLIVDAVGVLLGDRVENSVIRAQQPQAEIQGGFSIDAAHPALQHLRELGLDADRECILRRVVRRDKPSRAFINGRAVNASMLRELGRELADIHGQHEHHSLLSRAGQLALLDAAAGNGEMLMQLTREYDAINDVQTRIEKLRGDDTRARAELLKMQLEELEALSPRADEWPELEAMQKRMHHQNDLVSETQQVAILLTETDGDNIHLSIAECCRRLQRLLEYDARLRKVIALLEEAGVNIAESAEQLRALYAGDAPDAAQMQEIESRFSLYHELSRKHRVLPGLLADKLTTIRDEVAGLQDPAAELEKLDAQLAQHRAVYDDIAAKISARRKDAASRLAASVTELMQELGMAGGALQINLPRVENVSRRGYETAEFAASANPGLPPQPLTKTASGGELSRISLAINVALAADAPASTLIFDEVDVGIGGRVAEVVGEKLRQLGETRQIICITHLSQVAAKAHHHWSVEKHAAQVSVRALEGAARVEEIARMTAGAEVTPQSLAHAEQMLQSA